MLMVVINILSVVSLLAWCLLLLMVVAIIVMAMIEFGRALVRLVSGGPCCFARGSVRLPVAHLSDHALKSNIRR